jgi:hypothetical protein
VDYNVFVYYVFDYFVYDVDFDILFFVNEYVYFNKYVFVNVNKYVFNYNVCIRQALGCAQG